MGINLKKLALVARVILIILLIIVAVIVLYKFFGTTRQHGAPI